MNITEKRLEAAREYFDELSELLTAGGEINPTQFEQRLCEIWNQIRGKTIEKAIAMSAVSLSKRRNPEYDELYPYRHVLKGYFDGNSMPSSEVKRASRELEARFGPDLNSLEHED